MSTHPQCFACRIRATRCHTFQKDAAPRTSRPWAGGVRTCATPLVLCLPNMRQPLPHFPNRCHSSHRPAVAIKRSTQPPHGHQSASALESSSRIQAPHAMGRTRTSPLVLCLPNMRQLLPHFSNRCHSSHRPAVAIKRSTQPLHEHQSASARRSRHRTPWDAGVRTGTSPLV
eukprot:COSAG02_NODE_1009_length_15234_cov_9.594423_16_plen_171_part_01